MMRIAVCWIVLFATTTYAQERCDAEYPKVYCNTTEVLTYQSSSCTAYHIFIARGSDEPYPGRLGNITREICSSIGSSGCGFESIQYPAKSTAWGKDEWCKSASQGQANGQAQMKDYSQRCPNAKLILLGYSQGGAVAQDILGGGGGKVFECEQPDSPALDSTTTPGSQVIAAVTFGAVIRTHSQISLPQGVNFDGQRARTPSQLAALSKYFDRLRDYCHFGDPMCAVGSTPSDVNVHLNYFIELNEEVVPWVVGKAKADTNGQVSGGSTSSETHPSPPYSYTPAPAPDPSAATLANGSIAPQASTEPDTATSIGTSPMSSSAVDASSTPRQITPSSPSSFVLSTNILSQPSPISSIIAKPAATPSTGPSSIVSASISPTDTAKAQPSQTKSGSSGTASTPLISSAFVLPLAFLAMFLT